MTAIRLAPFSLSQLTPTRSPFARVVFGIDFGSASLAAARWAAQFIAPRADAIVSHIATGEDPTATEPPDDRSSLRGLVPALAGGLGGFAATLDSETVRTVVRVGRPSHWLSVVAAGAEANLIVLGRRGDANRKHIGEPNVIERVARRTSASVLVVPEGTLGAPQSIVAAIDESNFAGRVIRVARRLARMHELPLTLLHVLAPTAGFTKRGARASDEPAFTRHRRVWLTPGQERTVVPVRTSAWLDELANAPDVTPRERAEIVVGDAPREIISSGLAAGAPLVIVGARGADGAVPGSIGSVVRELLTRAPVPVLAVSG